MSRQIRRNCSPSTLVTPVLESVTVLLGGAAAVVNGQGGSRALPGDAHGTKNVREASGKRRTIGSDKARFQAPDPVNTLALSPLLVERILI